MQDCPRDPAASPGDAAGAGAHRTSGPVTDLIERLLFARRRAVLAAFALVTIAMGWLASELRIDAGFSKLVPVEHEYMQTFFRYQDEFGGADRVIIALTVRNGDMFTPEFISTLREVTDATFFLPGVGPGPRCFRS